GRFFICRRSSTAHRPPVGYRWLPAVPAPSRSGSLPLEAYLQSPVPRPQRYRRYHGAG
ncbi:hypothetical protein BFDFBN_BFDFBN_10530, partial [Dysosmobacter welbionis]